MNEFLLQFERVYHVTHPDNRESIQVRGLEPRQTSAIPEHRIPATSGDPKQVCFCLEQDVANYVDQMRQWGYEPIVCEIDTHAMVELRIAMDWTMDGTSRLVREMSPERFVEVVTSVQQQCAIRSLRELRTLACFDVIPAAAIQLREGAEFAGERQQTFKEWLKETDPNNAPDQVEGA